LSACSALLPWPWLLHADGTPTSVSTVEGPSTSEAERLAVIQNQQLVAFKDKEVTLLDRQGR
jgi:hypothetical protein